GIGSKLVKARGTAEIVSLSLANNRRRRLCRGYLHAAHGVNRWPRALVEGGCPPLAVHRLNPLRHRRNYNHHKSVSSYRSCSLIVGRHAWVKRRRQRRRSAREIAL